MKLFLCIILAYWIGTQDWSLWVELPLTGAAWLMVFDL